MKYLNSFLFNLYYQKKESIEDDFVEVVIDQLPQELKEPEQIKIDTRGEENKVTNSSVPILIRGKIRKMIF